MHRSGEHRCVDHKAIAPLAEQFAARPQTAHHHGPVQAPASSSTCGISYRFNLADQYRGAAAQVDRIPHGERPADMPVQQPTKFDLVINLTTAKTLGLIKYTSHSCGARIIIWRSSALWQRKGAKGSRSGEDHCERTG
jgi:hypothetical protein